jgi:hypothetical protein
MTNADIAELRYITDVMIQFQPKDSLSGAVLQAIYSESLVIVPEWQVYPILDQLGIHLVNVKDRKNIKEQILTYQANQKDISSRLKMDSKRVESICQWDSVTERWLSLYH